MSKPVVIDLCCGLGGWSKAFIEEGWDAIGFDIEKHEYGEKRYPGHLILKDIREINGHDLRAAVNPALIVASPPCQKYSYMAQPWKRAKFEGRWQKWERDSPFGDKLAELNSLYNACFRIARECGVPIVLENVKGAQPWVGRAAWHYGSYFLWGDVPALMPHTVRTVKVEGFNFHQHEKNGTGGSFQSAAVNGVKVSGDYFSGPLMPTNPRRHASGTGARKAASAMIAEIPFDLAQWIARVFKP